jgi:hypothetical protein
MARTEQDREDLLREATALVERVELQVAGSAGPIVAGFRRDQSLALYFGGDPVYQFNSAGALRRAFLAGQMYKAENGRLIRLVRERSADTTQLTRTELSNEEQTIALARVSSHLGRLQDTLLEHRYVVVGQVPADSDIVAKLQAALSALPQPLIVAERPNAG